MRTTSYRPTRLIECPRTGGVCPHAFEIARRLHAALGAAGGSVSDGFEITGHADTPQCAHPCRLTWTGTRAATEVVGVARPRPGAQEDDAGPGSRLAIVRLERGASVLA